MADESSRSSANSSGDALGALLITALVIGGPIALGWINEKIKQKEVTSKRQPVIAEAAAKAEEIPPAKSLSPATQKLIQLATRDLTAQDRRNELEPILGRRREVDRLVTLLSGDRPECILLIGESGIGKTALVEGLVQALHSGRAPDLEGCAILEFRPDSLIGTGGQGEEQALDFIASLSASQEEIIAFFDDFHAFARLGEGLGRYQNILAQFKQALADHKFRCVAAITPEEYQRYFETDSSWSGLFTELRIEKRNSPNDPFGELGEDQTFAILNQRTQNFRERFGLHARQESIQAAIQLSERYQTGQRLPGKALHLLENTARRLRPRQRAEPWELMALEEKIDVVQARHKTLVANPDPRTRLERADLENGLDELRLQRDFLRSRWQALQTAQQTAVKRIEQVAMLHRASESASLNLDSQLTKQLQSRLIKVQAEYDRAEESIEPLRASFRSAKDYLDASDVAWILEEQTGIPIQLPSHDEENQLKKLEEHLHQRVVGQEAAIAALARAIRRSRAGLSPKGRPVGNFIFLGPTGVGKTELAKALAEVQFGGEQAMVRLDMSEYHDQHAVARMVGAPPGYVGYEGGGQLTEAVRQRPASVVLLDEVEKAHPKVLDILLQVLEDGRLTDGRGRTVDFQHTIVIMTSNVGSQEILALGVEAAEPVARAALGNYFRPEFLNRLDAIIFFESLTPEHLRQIVIYEMRGTQERLRERYGLTLELTEQAVSLIVEQGYDPKYGAREIKRKIRELVLDPMVPLLLEKKFQPGATLVADRAGNILSIQAGEKGTVR